MQDRLAPLAIGTVWAITIAAVLGAAFADNAALAAGVGLVLASIIGGILFTIADQDEIPAAMRIPIPNRGWIARRTSRRTFS
jgi:tetrahydromethanopterin S-methyltransferase subunit C